jgi:hypothetical protein
MCKVHLLYIRYCDLCTQNVSCTLAKQCGICLTWGVDADGVLEAGADDDLRHKDGHEDEQKLEGSKTVLLS